MTLAVHLRSVVALLGRFPALAGADLDVEPGEIVLVQGANGAGKTTLLRACAGLVPVAAGEATVLGHDLRRDRRSVRKQVGLLGHTGFLYDDLTVEENVRFAARAAGLDIEELLTGPTAITYCAGDPVAVAKVLRAFSRQHPALVVKGGILDGKLLDAGETMQLADLASREELLARLAGAFQSVVAQPARLAQANLAKAARLFAALQEKRAGDGEATQPSEEGDAEAADASAERDTDASTV